MKATGIIALYGAGKRKAWNVETDLDWSVRELQQDFPVSPGDIPFAGFEPYDCLPRSQRVRIAWRLHGAEISDILCGESAALTLCAQMLARSRDLDHRLFLSTQVADEARHVEFFSRYLQTVIRQAPTASPCLAKLLNDAVRSPSVLHKRVVCQVIIESLAMARFRLLRPAARVPVLAQALTLIAADEARHVRFGEYCLGRELVRLGPIRRARQLDFIHRAVSALASDVASLLQIGREQGFESRGLLQHLRRRRVMAISFRQAVQQQLTRCLMPGGQWPAAGEA